MKRIGFRSLEMATSFIEKVKENRTHASRMHVLRAVLFVLWRIFKTTVAGRAIKL